MVITGFILVCSDFRKIRIKMDGILDWLSPHVAKWPPPGPGAYGCASVRLPSVRPSVRRMHPAATRHCCGFAAVGPAAGRYRSVKCSSTCLNGTVQRLHDSSPDWLTDWMSTERILNNPHHTLYQLLTPQSAASQNYNLRHRTHDRQLHQHQGHLGDCNFMTRLLYKNSYWLSNTCEC